MTEEKRDLFKAKLEQAFQFEGGAIILGGAMINGKCIHGQHVKIPLSKLTQHGFITGSPGSGMTRSLQILAEHLSGNSVPVLLMDIKGELGGLAKSSVGNPAIDQRHEAIGNLPFYSDCSPIEFLTLSGEKGVRLRATVTEFGPVLFSKLLDLNSAEQGIVTVIFKYCDKNKIPLLDLKDFKRTLQWFIEEGKREVGVENGRVSDDTVRSVMSKIIDLEKQGAERCFGERSFEVDDLVRINEEGKGVISILSLTDIQDRKRLFSTFILQILAEIYACFPDDRDIEQPKLMVFIDEAHLIFDEGRDSLQAEIEAIIKLIHTKGVGIVLMTQNPAKIPKDVLDQLGFSVQHAMPALDAKSRIGLRLERENYPISDIDQLLNGLGIGEALVTVLNEHGIPSPAVHTMMRAPQSSMDRLSKAEVNAITRESYLVQKYDEDVDRESAYEILGDKIEKTQELEHQDELRKQREQVKKDSSQGRTSATAVDDSMDHSMDDATRALGLKLARELTRGILGALGAKPGSENSEINSP